MRNWKQHDRCEYITQFTDEKEQEIEFPEDVLKGIMRNWKQHDRCKYITQFADEKQQEIEFY